MPAYSAYVLSTRSAVRVVAGAVAAALLLLAVPTPAAAAPTPKVTITDVAVTEGTGAAVNASFTIQVAPRPGGCCALQVSWATAPGFGLRARRLHFLVRDRLPHEERHLEGRHRARGRRRERRTERDVRREPLQPHRLSGIDPRCPGRRHDHRRRRTVRPLASTTSPSPKGTRAPRTATFTASLSAASANAVTFNWTTAAGSATAGADYVTASGSRTIAAGATTATIGITVNGDVQAEGERDIRHHAVQPRERDDRQTAPGSRRSPTTTPLPTLSVNDVSVSRGTPGTTTATFTVTLSAAMANTVTLRLGHRPGLRDRRRRLRRREREPDDRRRGDDRHGGHHRERRRPGRGRRDLRRHPLQPLERHDRATAPGVGTITDDDPLPTLSVNDVTVMEGNAGTTTATFTVTLSAASGQSRDVRLGHRRRLRRPRASTTSAANGSRTIAAGATTATVRHHRERRRPGRARRDLRHHALQPRERDDRGRLGSRDDHRRRRGLRPSRWTTSPSPKGTRARPRPRSPSPCRP